MPYLFRRPSPGELVGTTQAKRRITRRYHLRALDPQYQVQLAKRRAKRQLGYYSFGARLFRLALRMTRRKGSRGAR
jgi:hypothetical protein